VAAPEPLSRLARAVLDGDPVDWTSAESDADESQRRVIRELRVLHDLAALHRRDPAEAESWGHLRILERIGHGAFGAVYRAWDSRLDREVALKLLPATQTPGDPASSTIISEGRWLARVRHANVATIYGAERIGDQIGLWMEFVRGETLEQVLQKQGTLSVAETIDIGMDLCRALSAVHAAGLLHRDVKATNVMREADGRVVLMDFGAGRDLDDNSSSDLTGTPLYLAPEILEGQPATTKSDVYSLGVLLYHLLTGTYPVRARTLGQVRTAHQQRERFSLHAARPDVPSAVQRIVDRATDPDPARRYETAAAMAADLGAIARRRRVRVRPFVAAAAAVAVLAVTGAAWRLWSVPQRLAVVRFVNLGSSTDDALTIGFTREIHRSLTSIQGVELMAFPSGAAPNVDLVVSGSLLLAGDRISVGVLLTRAGSGEEVWHKAFEGPDVGMFEVPEEIAARIAEQLDLRRRPSTGAPHRPNPEVHLMYLRAYGRQQLRNAENAMEAAAQFQRVIDRDRDYAPAWAGLATALSEARRMRFADEYLLPPDPRIRDAATKALALDPDLAEAHAAMGALFAGERRWAEAQMEFGTALTLNPSFTVTHTEYVLSVLMPLGRLREALGVLEAARLRDPLSLDVARVKAHVQVELERYSDAIGTAQWVLERDANIPYARLWIGRAHALSGRYEEAEEIFKSDPDYWGYLGWVYARTNRRTEAEQLIAEHPQAPSRALLVLGGLEERDRAFAALSRLVDSNPWLAATWMRRPEVRTLLRGDARLMEIKQRLGLPADQ
jgi:serine/threonine-protein kinase